MKAAGWLLLLAVTALAAGCDRRPAPTPPAASAPASSTASAASAVPAVVPVPLAPASEVQASAADIEAGSRLAAQGAGAAAACSSCHGAHGEGQAAARFPRLAGLGAVYLSQQLDSYADGRRQHPVMEPIAKALQPQQRRQAAAYFASLDVPAGPAGTRAPAEGAAARLAWQGDEARQLPACANCHGRDGSGLGDSIPPLAGQPAGYLEDALAAWREGRRNTDPSGQMPRIAKALGPADAQALAAWYAALPMPPAADRRPAAFTSSLPAVTSSPVATPPAAQGTGTEQGAPLTGGGIGPGGAGATQQPASSPSRPTP
jgi:cytochrome c553